MSVTIPEIAKYLRFAVPPREAQNLTQGIVDFIRENREKSDSEYANSTSSFPTRLQILYDREWYSNTSLRKYPIREYPRFIPSLGPVPLV